MHIFFPMLTAIKYLGKMPMTRGPSLDHVTILNDRQITIAKQDVQPRATLRYDPP